MWLSLLAANPLARELGKWLLIGVAMWYVQHRAVAWIEQQRQDAVALRESQITQITQAAELKQAQADLAAERARLEVLTQQLAERREAEQQRVAIFNKHQLGDLVQAKPGLIEKRMNAATTEVWKQIELESHQ